MSPRSEPLLWVQLVNGGALPLEALFLLLLLAGADPGPLPALERLLAWALGAAAPALLLWQRPADPRSLLLLRGSGAGDQAVELPWAQVRRQALPRWAFALGVIALLPLLGWIDNTAALASQLSPLQGAGRLACLMASSGLLALMVWQWQQLVQAVCLLSHAKPESTEAVAVLPPNVTRLGLPLLRLPLLQWPEPVAPVVTAPTVGPEQTEASTEDPTPGQDPYSSDPPAPAAEPTEAEAPPQVAEEPTVSRNPEPLLNEESIDLEPVELEPGKLETVELQTVELEPVEFEPVELEPVMLESTDLEPKEPEEPEEPEVIDPEIIDPDQDSELAVLVEPPNSAPSLAVEPEQSPEQPQGRDLDQQVP